MTASVHDPISTYTFRLVRADYAAFERLPGELVGWDKFRLLLVPLVSVGMLAGLLGDRLGLPSGDMGALGSVLLGLAIAGIGYAISTLLLTLRTYRRIARWVPPATDTVVKVWTDHLTVAQDGRTDVYAWEMMTVLVSYAHVFICSTPRDATIMPRRAFESDADMHAFAYQVIEFGKYAETLDQFLASPTSKEPTP